MPVSARTETHRDRREGRFALFDRVALIASLQTEGQALPPGAAGTVVDILGGGRAYAVEFFTPTHCVVTVHDPLLTMLSANDPA